jgi:hypothetical protein
MAYHDELIELASELAHFVPPTQATLRRSVSTTYYALFHLLINDTVANWNRQSSRNSLGRMFDHGMMRRVSQNLLQASNLHAGGVSSKVIDDLKFVAKTFCDLQKKRHSADYDNGQYWELTEVLRLTLLCKRAFATWDRIKNADIAQEYLVCLLIKPPRDSVG